jgi:hypothetical protein
MTLLQLRQLLRWCYGALFLLGFIAIGRVGYVLWSNRSPTVTYTPVPSVGTSPTETPTDRSPSFERSIIERLKLRPAPTPSELIAIESAPQTTASDASATTPKAPPPIHVFLAVHQGPARSEIRLNGVFLGQTPFVGEITCKRDERLHFVLVPPKGMPRQINVVCNRSELTIDDKTPENPAP